MNGLDHSTARIHFNIENTLSEDNHSKHTQFNRKLVNKYRMHKFEFLRTQRANDNVHMENMTVIQ